MSAPRARRRTVAILGTGLIGTSIGLALRDRSARTHVIGWDAKRAHVAAAKRLGAIGAIAPSFRAAIASADVIVLAAPVDSILRLVPRALANARPGALVIDVGGIKAPVVAAATRALRRDGPRFVAGHPIAGREQTGPAGADAMLFAGRPFALYAPPQAGRARAWGDAEAFARLLGALPLRISPREHDRIIAATSALPQLASIALALAVHDTRPPSSARLAGPGYADATRLAQSSFTVWNASLFGNRRNVLRALRTLERRVAAISAALEHGDARKMSRFFSSAAAARRRILGTRRRSSRPRNQ